MSSTAAEGILSSPEAGGRVIRGSVWRTVGILAGVLAGLGTATLLLRHLGVTQSGRYVTVLSLVAIGYSVVDLGLNVSASRELALRQGAERHQLMADVIAQRLWVAPVAVLAIVAFALVAGYPRSMQIGAALAGMGLYVMAVGDALLLPLTVQLRNVGLAFVDFLKQAVTLLCVAGLVLLGAHLTAFFGVLMVAGLVVIATAPLLVGRGAYVAPRLDRARQRALLLSALPLAAALVLGQLYFRLVILFMSLTSDPRQVGWFGGSLRAVESLLSIPILVAGVALPLLAAAARDDRDRLRAAVQGLSEGTLIAGVLAVLLAVRTAEPVMRAIGGPSFAPAGAVLRIQVGALLFSALTQIWAVSLLALGRRRELILTNTLALLALAGLTVLLVPAFGAKGGAVASVLGDAVLAALTCWRLRAAGVHVQPRARFLARVALAAAVAIGALALPLPNLVAAALAGALFLLVGQLIGMVPEELHDAFGSRRLLWWRARSGTA